MPDTRGTKLEVVDIVAHPSCAAAAALAQLLYRLLGRDPGRPNEDRAGFQVRFWTDRPAFERAVDASGHVRLLLLVIDDELVQGPWAGWAREAVAKGRAAGAGRVIPLVLATRVRAVRDLVGTTNFVMPADCRRAPAADPAFVNDVLAAVLDAVVPRASSHRVFLCYSRTDGRPGRDAVAASLRACRNLEPYYDERDLVGGIDYHDRFDQVIRDGTVLAVWTDDFSARAETVRELLVAKAIGRPVLIVAALAEGDPRAFPYLGNAPVVRLAPDPATGVDHALNRHVLTLVLRHALNVERVDAACERLRQVSAWEDVIGLYAHPDAASLVSRGTPRGRQPDAGTLFVHPDPPLPPAELGVLERLFPARRFLTPVQACALEAATAGRGRPLAGLRVQLSASSPGDDALAGRGLGPGTSNVDQIVLDVARLLLAAGASVVFGGRFGQETIGLPLLRLQGLYGASGTAGEVRAILPWPVAHEMDACEKRRLGLTVDFEVAQVPPDVHDATAGGTMLPADPRELTYVWWRCLTETRRFIVESVDACVFIGGKESGYLGRYAGVVEEALVAVENRRPIYLLGALGGAAASVYGAVAGHGPGDPPSPLGPDLRGAGLSDEGFVRFYDERCPPRDRTDGDAPATAFRRFGHGGLAATNHLSAGENEVLYSGGFGEATALLLAGLARLARAK